MEFPAAPWPGLLKLMTGLGTVVLMGLMLALGGQADTRLVAGAPFAVWALCAWYMVRGFRLDGDTLVIRRLSVETRIPLKGLTLAEHVRKRCSTPVAVSATVACSPLPAASATTSWDRSGCMPPTP